MTISVLLVDDHAVFRESVCDFLLATTNFCILGEAEDGIDAIAKLTDLHPDVVILDCKMPRKTGLEVALWVREKQPDTQVVMLSMHSEDDYMLGSIRNGAKGYILKDEIVPHLALAVVAVAKSQFYFSPGFRKLLDFQIKNRPRTNGDKNDRIDSPNH